MVVANAFLTRKRVAATTFGDFYMPTSCDCPLQQLIIPLKKLAKRNNSHAMKQLFIYQETKISIQETE